MAWLSVNNLKKEYDDFSLDASFECAQGEHLAILGPSGAGKSTLLRSIAGLIPVDSGQIVINNRNVALLPPRNRGIGMVFQDYALFPHYTVAENIAYGIKNLRPRLSTEELRERIKNLLVTFAMEGFDRRRVDELSGGERQRVALARALAVRPFLMLFDEPLASLDVSLRRVLRAELHTLQRHLGYTAISVTHDQEDALSVGDRIVVMRQGRVVQCGTPEEIYKTPNTAFVAGFFGENNLIPIREWDGAVLKTDFGVITSNDTLKARESWNIDSYILSIRAEDVRISDPQTTINKIKLIIVDFEYHGRDYLVSGEYEGKKLKFRSIVRPARGDTITVVLPPEDIRLISDDRY